METVLLLQDFELIIINDNSKDGSLKKIKNFKKEFNNFTILNNKNNLGPGLSRNKGIFAAKGKYIMFIDGDDFLPKNSLKNIQKCLINKNYDFIGYNFKKLTTDASQPGYIGSHFDNQKLRASNKGLFT